MIGKKSNPIDTVFKSINVFAGLNIHLSHFETSPSARRKLSKLFDKSLFQIGEE
jgi:hypothetical protein